MRDKIFTTRISEEVFTSLKEIAKKEQRSFSFMVDKILTEYVDKQKQKNAFIINVSGNM